MGFRIQRVAQGLNNLLNIFGGEGPIELEDRIRGTLELIQMYGMTQLQSGSASNAAAAEGASVSFVPSTDRWTVLFGAQLTIVKTATMTALRGSINIRRTSSANFFGLASQELGPFGATETGPCKVPFVAPYPMLLPPGSSVIGLADIIGTDATANVIVVAEFGTLG